VRIDKILDKASALMEEQIQIAYARLQAHYDLHYRDLDSQIAELFQQLFSMGAAAQQEEGKGPINCLSVSYLYSSLFTGSGEFHLALYDERIYFDEDPTIIYWSPGFLFEQFNQDIEIIKEALAEQFARLKKYELDALKMEYAQHFFEIGHKMFADYSAVITSALEESALITTPDFTVTYGGYLDAAAIIWQGGRQS